MSNRRYKGGWCVTPAGPCATAEGPNPLGTALTVVGIVGGVCLLGVFAAPLVRELAKSGVKLLK